MKFTQVLSIAVVSATLCFTSCQKETEVVTQEQISEETLSKIYQLGFGTKDVQKVEGGYLVEGDILLSDADLNSTPDKKLLRVGTEEQYHTTNLVRVGSTSRLITISISNKLPASYVTALDLAISRYNTENLLLTFQRVSSGANISIVSAGGNFLASAGFPSGGNPYNQVKVNARAIGDQPKETVASILAHEIGHCIGFRHTDYMDRSYSCGGQVSNEGASTVGAIHIPGTPIAANPNSWMLACIGSGDDRPFNTNDRTALNYLY